MLLLEDAAKPELLWGGPPVCVGSGLNVRPHDEENNSLHNLHLATPFVQSKIPFCALPTRADVAKLLLALHLGCFGAAPRGGGALCSWKQGWGRKQA